MKKGLVGLLIVGLLVVAAVPALAGNGQNAREDGIGLGQGVTRAYIGELLKMDEDALREARKDGVSMIAIAESQGYAADEFAAAVVNFRKGQVAKMVANGTMTAEQAENCEVTMAARIQANLERVPEPKGRMAEGRQMRQGRSQ
jgi:hypothetical protein